MLLLMPLYPRLFISFSLSLSFSLALLHWAFITSLPGCCRLAAVSVQQPALASQCRHHYLLLSLSYPIHSSSLAPKCALPSLVVVSGERDCSGDCETHSSGGGGGG